MQAGIIYGISVFVGIVAGIGVTIGVDLVKEKRQSAHDRNNLIFEIRSNLSKIEKWLELIAELRNTINSDRIVQFNGYFNLSSAIFVTMNRLFQESKLYTYLSYSSIEKLQENETYLSLTGENMFYNQLTQHKQASMNGYQNVKQFAANDVDFWEKVLKQCKDNFEDILKELE
jgi:hypothetical protein